MKEKKTKVSSSERFLELIRALWPLAKGSVACVRKPCIRPTCRACAEGQKHPAYLLAFSQNGRRRCMYIPIGLVGTMQRAIQNGRKLERLLNGLGPELIRAHRQNRAKGLRTSVKPVTRAKSVKSKRVNKRKS